MNAISSSALLVREEPLHIRYRDRSETVNSKVYFDLSLNNSLIIEPQGSLHNLCDAMGEVESFFVTFPDSSKPTECYSVGSRHRSGGENPGHFFQLSPRHSNLVLQSGAHLVRIEAGVLNFANYFIPGDPERQRFKLQHHDWEFCFLPVDDQILSYPPHIQTKEYAFTHHVKIQRVDVAAFSPEEAQQQLEMLADFLTFCRGYWVSTALTNGFGTDGTVAMQNLGTGKVSPQKDSSNWLDFHSGNSMAELFPNFIDRMLDPRWQETFRHALYWYVRADTTLVGPDGGCILLQAALERLAWHVLVRDRQSLSEDGFSKLPAADQIRLLLSALNIPLVIPNGLTEVTRIGKELNWMDAPQAFAEIRNRLVHPPKLKKAAPKQPYFEAYTLGKWYVELVLLSACGYRGKYSNRTKLHRWVGEVEDVPWAKG